MWKKTYPINGDKALLETRELFKMSHPNAVRIQDTYFTNSSHTQVYDYIRDSNNLEDEINRRNKSKYLMKEQIVMKNFAQIILVFKDLHAIPKWHRNICASHFIFKKVEHFGSVLKCASFGTERDVMVS